MPQMMPMYWLFMSIISMIMLMIMTSFIYFLLIYPIFTPNKLFTLKIKMLTWPWKW